MHYDAEFSAAPHFSLGSKCVNVYCAFCGDTRVCVLFFMVAVRFLHVCFLLGRVFHFLLFVGLILLPGRCSPSLGTAETSRELRR